MQPLRFIVPIIAASGLALRLNDKGDLSDAQVTVINLLNQKEIDGAPMRLQIFSKRPELLRKINDYNLRMLSIDSSNFELALENHVDLLPRVRVRGRTRACRAAGVEDLDGRPHLAREERSQGLAQHEVVVARLEGVDYGHVSPPFVCAHAVSTARGVSGSLRECAADSRARRARPRSIPPNTSA